MLTWIITITVAFGKCIVFLFFYVCQLRGKSVSWIYMDLQMFRGKIHGFARVFGKTTIWERKYIPRKHLPPEKKKSRSSLQWKDIQISRKIIWKVPGPANSCPLVAKRAGVFFFHFIDFLFTFADAMQNAVSTKLLRTPTITFSPWPTTSRKSLLPASPNSQMRHRPEILGKPASWFPSRHFAKLSLRYPRSDASAARAAENESRSKD